VRSGAGAGKSGAGEVGVDCRSAEGVGEFSGRAVGPGAAGVAEAEVGIKEAVEEAGPGTTVSEGTVKVRVAFPAVAAGGPAVLIRGAAQAAMEDSRIDRITRVFEKAAGTLRVMVNEDLRLLRK